MEKLPYGIVIKVRNIELCRSFYRDVLDLGAPVMDSNFWVEFRLADSLALCLEKIADGDTAPTSEGGISWIFRTDELDTLVDRLHKYGYNPVPQKQERVGFKTLRFLDPEGTPFMVSSESPGKLPAN